MEKKEKLKIKDVVSEEQFSKAKRTALAFVKVMEEENLSPIETCIVVDVLRNSIMYAIEKVLK